MTEPRIEFVKTLEEMRAIGLDFKVFREVPMSEIAIMDPKAIAFGMKLARDAIQHTAMAGYEATGVKALKTLAETLDTFPIIGGR